MEPRKHDTITYTIFYAISDIALKVNKIYNFILKLDIKYVKKQDNI